MYELIIRNQTGVYSKITGDDLDRLKVIATRLNSNGCDVEIIEKKVVFRLVQIEK